MSYIFTCVMSTSHYSIALRLTRIFGLYRLFNSGILNVLTDLKVLTFNGDSDVNPWIIQFKRSATCSVFSNYFEIQLNNYDIVTLTDIVTSELWVNIIINLKIYSLIILLDIWYLNIFETFFYFFSYNTCIYSMVWFGLIIVLSILFIFIFRINQCMIHVFIFYIQSLFINYYHSSMTYE